MQQRGLRACNLLLDITDDMQRTAARQIERGVAKNDQCEANDSDPIADRTAMQCFVPYRGLRRRAGTGCITEINDHLFEGRYSPKWPDGKKHSRNVYAKTREECEEKLALLIEEMKADIRSVKAVSAETGEVKIDMKVSEKRAAARERKREVFLYLGLHPTEKNIAQICRDTGVDRKTARKYFDEFHQMRNENMQNNTAQ